MNVRIRLAPLPHNEFRIVVTDSRKKRSSGEVIGFYKSKKLFLNIKRFENWLSQGAQINDSVKKLLVGFY